MTNFYDDWETGDLSKWPATYGNAAASATAKRGGSLYGLLINPIAGTSTASSVATSTTKWAQGTFTYAHISAWFMFTALPSDTTADIFTLQNCVTCPTAGSNHFDFFYKNTTGTFWIDLEGATTYLDTGLKPTLNHWYYFQAKVYYGATTHTAEIQIDGTTYGPISDAGESAGYVRSFHIGTTSTTKTFTLYVDDISVNVGTSAFDYVGYTPVGKKSGLGDNLYFHGYDISGDTNSVVISSPMSPLEVTGINKSAIERIGGQRDGNITWKSYFNDATNMAHAALSPRAVTDKHIMYCRGTTLGDPAACMIAKQGNYDPTRGIEGDLLIDLQALANGYGLNWGTLLTAGIRTDTGATNGTAVDSGAATTNFGLQAFLQVFSFTGTDATVKIQESSDNGADAYADVVGGGFTQITTNTRTGQRIATSATLAVERYLRVATVTTGGFTSLEFAVVVCRNKTATVF